MATRWADSEASAAWTRAASSALDCSAAVNDSCDCFSDGWAVVEECVSEESRDGEARMAARSCILQGKG